MSRIAFRWVLVAGAVVSLVTGCVPDEETIYEYLGTWANPAYNGHGGGPPGKAVFTATEVSFFENESDVVPLETDSWSITHQDGNFYRFTVDSGLFGFLYGIARISSGGNVLETNAHPAAYPPRIDPAGSAYAMLYRR